MRLSAGGIILAFIVLSVGAYLIWFWMSFDRVPVQRSTGFEREARINRLLAAEYLLEELGMDAQSFSRFSELPPPGATLFLPTSRRTLPDETVDDLKTWTLRSGHLLVMAPPISERKPDRLLADLGVEGREAAPIPDDEAANTQVRLDTSARGLQIRFYDHLSLRTES